MRLRSVVLVLVGALAAHAPAATAEAGRRAPAATRAPRWRTLPLPPAMPAPATTGAVTVDRARIRYATWGARDAPGGPVVLLHGGMGNADHFAPQLPALVDRFFVIAIDTRGHGRSTLGDGPLSYHRMGTDVLAVLDELGVTAAAFVGWSDGGIVALDLAITAPARVTRFAVIGSNYDRGGNLPRKGPPPATMRAYTRACRAQFAAFGGTPRAFAAMLAAMRPVWRSEGYTAAQLAAITAPALVTVGAHDELIAVDHVREMARLIPGARLAIFEDASHFAMWQAPAEVNAALGAFLAPPAAPRGGKPG